MTRFFLLAGGYGKRAQPLSLIKPKPLFTLGGKPLIFIILKQLNDMGIHSGFVNLHYKSKDLKESLKNVKNINPCPRLHINCNFLTEKGLNVY